MKLKITFSIVAIFMALFVFDALNNQGHTTSGGSPAGRTGSPGDGATCAGNNCHSGTATAQTGWITTNIPAQGYVPGSIYTITATATYAGLVKYGFEVACQNASGTALGTLINTSTQTQLMGGTYITHTSTGTTGSGSKTWTFSWKAPAAGTGTVTFYGAFNCSNNDGHASGDIIYTSSTSVSEVSISGVDAGVVAFTAPALRNCTSSVTPVVNVRNYGNVTMTSCTVNYSIDNGTPVPFTWNGSLAAATTASVTLPAATVSVGLHTIKAYTTSPNGGADSYALDDTATTYFSANGALPTFTEGFESSTFPPAGWSLINADNSTTWDRVMNAHHSGTAAARMANYFYASTGQIDELESPIVSVANSINPQLSFYVAYAMYTGNAPETLSVFISTDCGSTWTSIYTKTSTALQTAAATQNEFVPTSVQWRKDSVDLSAYTTFPNIIVKFRNTNEYGNDLFLDDINITASPTGITEETNTLTDVSLYPNPANNSVNVGFSLNSHENVTIKMYDIYGKLISTCLNEAKDKGYYSMNVDLKNYAAGLYFLNVTAGESTTVKKVFVQK